MKKSTVCFLYSSGTRRSVVGSTGNDFVRQLAERNAEVNGSSAKKFRSSAAPKGTKLGSRYQDRTQLRTSGDEDEKAVRVKALEEMVKLGQMDISTFEALRDEIIGGDVKDVHLVKGLDYKLLERVRRGENVLAEDNITAQSDELDSNRPLEEDVDVDDEFEKLEEKEIQPMAKEEKSKNGEMAPPPAVVGKKRTRDEILKELKASRLAAAESAKRTQQSALGPRFLKVGEKKNRSRVDKDEQGREVLITVDEDGSVKRKVKKVKIDDNHAGHGLLMPDKDLKPLGSDVIPFVQPAAVLEDPDNEDIFEGVGADYNPLGAIEDDEEDSNKSDEEPNSDRKDNVDSGAGCTRLSPNPSESRISSSMPPPSIPLSQSASNQKRDYFGGSKTEPGITDNQHQNSLSDPAILAALKKASTIDPILSAPDAEEAARLARHKKMLESYDRDAEDMDMEFGGSRFDDAEDGEDRKVKLSVWGGDSGGGDRKVDGKRKRKKA